MLWQWQWRSLKPSAGKAYQVFGQDDVGLCSVGLAPVQPPTDTPMTDTPTADTPLHTLTPHMRLTPLDATRLLLRRAWQQNLSARVSGPATSLSCRPCKLRAIRLAWLQQRHLQQPSCLDVVQLNQLALLLSLEMPTENLPWWPPQKQQR